MNKKLKIIDDTHGRNITDRLESQFYDESIPSYEENDGNETRKSESTKTTGFSSTSKTRTKKPMTVQVIDELNKTLKTKSKRNRSNKKLWRSTWKEMSDRLKTYVDSIAENYSVQTISNIFKVSLKDPTKTFKDLYKLLYDEQILILAYSNIANNSGSNTPGTTSNSIDGTSIKLIKEIQTDLKNKNYQFSPFRRILIDKPPKPGDKKDAPKKQRPLGIPEWKDRIVQEALRIILNAVYEPLFYQEGWNYGFRPKLGCQHAIEYIKNNCRSLPHVIEGDIKGAYDNVDFEILLNMLRKKIKDSSFIKLIKNSLHCGLEFKKQFQETLIGVPQGSIVSPLFFNIYMHEFDKYILKELKTFIETKNTPKWNAKYHKKYMNSESKSVYKKYFTKETNNLVNARRRITRKIHTLFPKKTQYELLKTRRKEQSESWNQQLNDFFTLRKQYWMIHRKRLQIRSSDPNKADKRLEYVRYADDWVIFSNLHLNEMTQIKEQCKTFLLEKLKLQLAEDKTKITDIQEKQVKFLGFNISFYKERITTAKKFSKDSPKTLIHQHWVRTTSGLIKVGLDRERIISRLMIKNFINLKEFPTASWAHAVLNTYDIIQYYNSIIRGFINYYIPCITRPYYIYYLIYLLNYSCAHTLALKYRTTLSNIFNKFGKPIWVEVKINEKKSKTVTLLMTNKILKPIIEQASLRNYILNHDLKQTPKTIEIILQEEEIKDPFSFKFLNWRAGTILKATNCCICGISNQLADIQIHHTKHIAKDKTNNFSQIIWQINWKQIPVCKTCHQKIHNGMYDGIKLSDFSIPKYLDMEIK